MQFLSLLLLQILSVLLIGVQWKLVLSSCGETISFKNIISMNMAGTFFESITPSAKFGGEAVKILYLKNISGLNYSRSTSIVLLQKTISMLSFIFVFIVFVLLYLFTSQTKINISNALLPIFILPAVLFVILIFSNILIEKGKKSRIEKINLIFTKVSEFKVDICKNFRKLHENPKKALYHYLLGIFIWSIFSLKTFLVIYYLLGINNIVLSGVLTFIPYTMGMVPFLPGGLLLFEGSFTSLAVIHGISAVNALTCGVIIRFITYWIPFIFSSFFCAISGLKTRLC